MAKKDLWADLPCDRCGNDTGCQCPPCDCVWCRHTRGETADAERRMIEARDRAFEARDARQSARQMSQQLGEALRAYKKEQ